MKQNYEQNDLSNNFLSDILNSTGDPIFVKDINSRFVFVNDALCVLLGISRDQIIGQTLNGKLPDYQMMNFLSADKDVIDSGLEKTYEQELTISNGSILTILIKKTRYIDESGDIFLVGVIHDISNRKLKENELKLNNEKLSLLITEKDKFFSVIAHDLRSPFSAFLGLTEIMCDSISDMKLSEIEVLSLSMKNSATSLYRLLENLLEWSLLQRELIVFNPTSFLLAPKILEDISLIQESANKKWIEIKLNISDDLMVVADSNMLKSIIINLVSNSIKFTEKRGVIHISAVKKEYGLIEIHVKDTGIGMNQEMIDNLFKIDIKTNRIGTEGELSSGLGLILCKEFVEKHGGELWVKSRVGKGTTFSFSLP